MRSVTGVPRNSLAQAPGRNTYSGGSGDDIINAFDGKRQTVNCGPGRDRARLDRFDRARGCERIRRAR